MKKLITIGLILVSTLGFSKTEKAKKIKSAPFPKTEVKKKIEPPCDTKEDVLKKLEEEKKKQKPFSLQGGNTGCSVDAVH